MEVVVVGGGGEQTGGDWSGGGVKIDCGKVPPVTRSIIMKSANTENQYVCTLFTCYRA